MTRPSWLTDRARVIIGRSMAVASVVGALGGWSIQLANGHWLDALDYYPFILMAVGFGALTWIVMPSDPENGSLWALTWAGLFAAVDVVGGGALLLFDSVPIGFEELHALSPAELPLAAAILLWPGRWSWLGAIFLFATIATLRFPDGRLLGPRWRWVERASGVAIGVPAIMLAVLWFPTSTFSSESESAQTAALIEGLSLSACLVLAIVSVASLVLRYRRGTGELRSQVRLAVFGILCIFVLSLPGVVVEILLGGAGASGTLKAASDLEPLIDAISFTVLVGSFAVAIARFRLYDVDVIISKTATYFVLAVLIAAVYVGLVVGVSSLIGGRSSFWLSIAATTVIAIAFQPVRRIVQAAANRMVFGHRASHYETLARFSKRAVDSSDDELIARVPRLIVDGTSAASATLWLRSDDGFLVAGSWPDLAPGPDPECGPGHTERAALDGERFSDPAADRSIPISHDDELLGGLSVVVARGEKFTPRDESLLADLAAGLSLALRNARLTSSLRERVAELEASRQRVLTATDEARQALERDLNLGPQQQLLALKQDIASTCHQAGEVGADKLATMLAGLKNDTETAIDTVSGFASGIYPPVLREQGPATAIIDQTLGGPIAVAVDDRGLRRHSPEAESAIYFAVLEALQNAAKHAEATSAAVTFSEVDQTVVFDVRDDGCGFDVDKVLSGGGLSGLRDRLDTVRGRVSIVSNLGRGTTVTGSVPI